MRAVAAFGVAFVVTDSAFAIATLMIPPASEVGPAASMDTHALAVSSKSELRKDYECYR